MPTRQDLEALPANDRGALVEALRPPSVDHLRAHGTEEAEVEDDDARA